MPKGSGYVNLQRYLNANQGALKAASQRLAGQMNSEADQSMDASRRLSVLRGDVSAQPGFDAASNEAFDVRDILAQRLGDWRPEGHKQSAGARAFDSALLGAHAGSQDVLRKARERNEHAQRAYESRRDYASNYGQANTTAPETAGLRAGLGGTEQRRPRKLGARDRNARRRARSRAYDGGGDYKTRKHDLDLSSVFRRVSNAR